MTDDEKTEEKTEKPKVKKTWGQRLKGLIKWLLIMGVLVFILLTALSRMGGNSDVLRETIEDFLTDNTPYTARIVKLNHMHFFPSVVIDVEGVELRGGSDGTGETAVRVDSARFVMGFFDLLFQPGNFKDVQIQGLSAQSGSIFSKPLNMDYLKIIDEEGAAHIEAKGKIGEYDAHATLGLASSAAQGRRVYKIGAERPFEISIAALKAQGTFRNTITGINKLENFSAGVGDTLALSGNLDINPQSEHRHSIKGQLRIEPGKSELDPNLVLDHGQAQPKLFGVIRGEHLILEDITGDAPLIQLMDELDKIFGSGEPGIDLSAVAPDVTLDFKGIKGGSISWGALKTPIKLEEEETLRIGPITGQIMGGELNGDIVLKAEGESAELKTKLSIKNFDYAALQKQFMDQAQIDGTAHIAIDLASKGQTFSQLIDRLSGKAGFVGGKAEMNAGILNIWGGGLLNALLPSFEEEADLNVNCVVANLDIENLKGRSDAVFVDTQRITLHGEGTYDFKKDNLEMVLEPKAKDVAIVDIASAINISGPLSDLQISPNVFSLGEKVGGILLGAVNPAFYALTLTDLGLNDDHPCKAFVIEKEVLPAPEEKPQEPEAATQETSPAEDTVGNQ